eukprot:COSAG01_NODE_687_length_14245_cov_40.399548_17_plen_281_part_00
MRRHRDLSLLRLPLSTVMCAISAAVDGGPGSVFTGPAFDDGPYNSALGALGSRDKGILSQEGVLTRLTASDGAAGMGQRPIGESIRIVRRENVSLRLLSVTFDEATPLAPVHLISSTYGDGVRLEMRVLQVDGGTGADLGFVFNVTAHNTGPDQVGVAVVAAVDFMAGLVSADGGLSLSAAATNGSGHRRVLCGPPTTQPHAAAAAGHLGSDGFRPGRDRSSFSGSGGGGAGGGGGKQPAWARSWALAGNYPGQLGHVAKPVGGAAKVLRYRLAGPRVPR